MRTVLVVESHGPTLDLLERVLQEGGFEVRKATSPVAGYEQCVLARPDAVVVAVDLPALDGQPVSAKIRALENAARLPIVVVDHGHLGATRGIQAILSFKANGYIPDPSKPAELVKKLQSLVQNAEEAAAAPLRIPQAPRPTPADEPRPGTLPELVHAIYRERQSGTLVLVHGTETRRLRLHEGMVVGYQSSVPTDRFSHHLADVGLISRDSAAKVESLLKDGKDLSGALKSVGLGVEEGQLEQRLQDYLADKAAAALARRDLKHAFEPARDARAPGPARLSPLAALLTAARKAYPLRALVEPLQPWMERFPSRAPTFSTDLKHLGLSANDLKVAMQMNGRIRLRDLLAHGRGDVRLNTSVLWLLTLTKNVVFEDRPVAASAFEAQPAPEQIAPKKRKPLAPQTVAELREAALKIITGSYFHALGLPISAESEQIEKTYQETARRFHADSYPEDTSELHPLFEAVQEKLSAAQKVLTSTEKRRAYLEHVLAKEKLQRSTSLNVEAEVFIRRGDDALKRGDPTSAAKLYEAAIELNGKEAAYYSRLAWATFLEGSGPLVERAKAAHKHVKKALGMDSEDERANVISAVLEDALGDVASARKRLIQLLGRLPDSRLARAALRKVGR